MVAAAEDWFWPTTNDRRPTTDDRRRDSSRSLLQPIHQRKQENSQDRICDGCTQLVRPAPVQIQADHSAGNEEVEDFVDDIETRGHQQPRAYAFHVEFHAQRRGPVSYECLGNSIYA